jgi:Ca2+/Na+ antiporter
LVENSQGQVDPSLLKLIARAHEIQLRFKTGLVILGASLLFMEVLQAGALGIVQAVLVVFVVWYACFWLCRSRRYHPREKRERQLEHAHHADAECLSRHRLIVGTAVSGWSASPASPPSATLMIVPPSTWPLAVTLLIIPALVPASGPTDCRPSVATAGSG